MAQPKLNLKDGESKICKFIGFKEILPADNFHWYSSPPKFKDKRTFYVKILKRNNHFYGQYLGLH